MINKVIVASYGGSGSTFLAKKIHELLPEVNVYHTHSIPANGIVGVPTRNLFTGHDEGPLSNWYSSDKNTKVILIARTPSHAYKSRACYKHFAHIWWGADVFKKTLGNIESFEESGNEFNEVWKAFIQDKKDILHLRDYLDKWFNSIENGEHNIFFVKYESLIEHWDKLLEFLEVPISKESGITNEFEVKYREVDNNTARLMNETDEFYDALPHYKQSNLLRIGTSCAMRLDTEATFSVERLNAGFGDSFARMDLIHRFVKQISNAKFVLPNYKNYHSKDLDFFELFSLKSELDNTPHEREITIKFSEFINHVYAKSEFITQKVHFRIVADLYERDSYLAYYPPISSEYTLKKNIKFFDSDKVLSAESHTKKVTIHLRRSDISRKYFEGLVSENVLNGIHTRPLLSVQEGVEQAKAYFGKEQSLRFIIVSDGVDDLRERFSLYPELINKLDEITEEIYDTAEYDFEFSYVVGKSKDKTIETYQAFASSDLVITRSSCFPNLICELCNVKLLHV